MGGNKEGVVRIHEQDVIALKTLYTGKNSTGEFGRALYAGGNSTFAPKHRLLGQKHFTRAETRRASKKGTLRRRETLYAGANHFTRAKSRTHFTRANTVRDILPHPY